MAPAPWEKPIGGSGFALGLTSTCRTVPHAVADAGLFDHRTAPGLAERELACGRFRFGALPALAIGLEGAVAVFLLALLR
jgi:hypothetical protein